MKKNKTIIGVWNVAAKGKSSTLLEIANELLLQYPKKCIYSSKNINHLTIDFRLIPVPHSWPTHKSFCMPQNEPAKEKITEGATKTFPQASLHNVAL
ncbi:MAG: hypothetical protein ACK4UK_02190 [Flavobacterium sp.]